MQTMSSQNEAVFFHLIRELARDGGMKEEISDEEARAACRHFAPASATGMSLPPEGTAEFFVEMARRAREDGPPLTGPCVVAFLRALRVRG